MKLYAFIAAICLFAAPALCAASLPPKELPQHVEFYMKSGMGCLEAVDDAYPSYTGGFGFRFPNAVYGMPLVVGLDTHGYADQTRFQAGAWLKSVVIYQPFKSAYWKNLYGGAGLSAGLVRKSCWTEMSPEKQKSIVEDWELRKQNPNSKEFNPLWEPMPEDRHYWHTTDLGGIYFEGLIGYEWYPTFFRNVYDVGGDKHEGLVPLRMFVEVSARHAVVPFGSSSISSGPYLQMDFGVGF